MKMLSEEQKDRLGEFWNQIVDICDSTDLSPMEVSFVLRRIAFTIECHCEGEAKARRKEVGSNVEETSI